MEKIINTYGFVNRRKLLLIPALLLIKKRSAVISIGVLTFSNNENYHILVHKIMDLKKILPLESKMQRENNLMLKYTKVKANKAFIVRVFKNKKDYNYWSNLTSQWVYKSAYEKYSYHSFLS